MTQMVLPSSSSETYQTSHTRSSRRTSVELHHTRGEFQFVIVDRSTHTTPISTNYISAGLMFWLLIGCYKLDQNRAKPFHFLGKTKGRRKRSLLCIIIVLGCFAPGVPFININQMSWKWKKMFQFELQAHAESLHFRTEPFSDERKENVFGRKYAVLSSSEALDGYNFLFKLKQNYPLIQTRNGPYSKIGPLISDKVSEISGVDHYQQISWFHGITSRYA